MKLNAAEKALMNNPVRALVQRYYEAPLLERLGAVAAGGRALEGGWGTVALPLAQLLRAR